MERFWVLLSQRNVLNRWITESKWEVLLQKKGAGRTPQSLVAQTVTMHKDSDACYIAWFGGSFA